jgi:hypothetical protein
MAIGVNGGLYPYLAKKTQHPINSITVKISLPALDTAHKPPAIASPNNGICCGQLSLDIQGHFTYIFHPTKGILLCRMSSYFFEALFFRFFYSGYYLWHRSYRFASCVRMGP